MFVDKTDFFKILPLLALLSVGTAQAAVQRVDLINETTLTHAFLFAGELGGTPALEFVDLELRHGFREWRVDLFDSRTAVLSGAEVAPWGGRIRLSFMPLAIPPSLQWAHVVYDGGDYTITASGTRSYDGVTGLWTVGPAFSPVNAAFIGDYFALPPNASVPLPGSAVLLLPAIAFLVAARRRAGDGDAALDV